MSIKFGVVVFPGIELRSRCLPRRARRARPGRRIPLAQGHSLKGVDVVVLPGGFAHGDYLRTGAIARFSPIMPAIQEFAKSGGPVIGICNGFQVLLESGLLPGAMLRNRDLKFHCEHVTVCVEHTDTPFTAAATTGAAAAAADRPR